MAKVIVIGAGLGGVSVAFELREVLSKQHSVMVIGEGEEFNFVPSNP
jgi:sulfide:quinone oxidoreductase